MGFDWGDVKRGAIAFGTGGLSEAPGLLDYVPGGDSVSRSLGISSSKADELPEAAKQSIAQSNANAQSAYDLALQQAIASGAYTGPGNIQAYDINTPIIQAAAADRTGTVAQATPQSVAYQAAPARGYSASLADAYTSADKIRGYDAVAQQVERAPIATSANVADVDTSIDAPDIAPVAQTSLVDLGKTTVGYAGIDPMAYEARDESLRAARAIANSPSAAAAQFKAGMDQATSDALAVAAQARGSDRAAARREAMIQMSQKGAQAAESSAALAAQEDTAKRAAYSQALQGVRGADVSTAQTEGQIKSALVQTQAQIDAQREQVKAQLNAAIAQGNTQAINALSLQQANLDMEAKKASLSGSLQQQSTGASLAAQNAKAQNDIALYNAQAKNSANALNATEATKAAAYLADAKNAAAREDATIKTNVGLANASSQTKAAADLAAASNAINSQYAQAQTATSATNAQLGAAREEANAQRAASMAVSDAANKQSANTSTGQAQLAASTSNASNQLDAAKTNVSSGLQTQQLNQAGKSAGISAMNQAAGIQGSNATGVIGAQAAAAKAQADRDAGLISAGSSAAAALSDERAKTNIKSASGKEIDDLAEKLSAYKTWSYKPGYADGGESEHGGWMAQDLEKSPLGRKFVSEDEDGMKHVDMMSLAALMAASAARSIRKSKGSK